MDGRRIEEEKTEEMLVTKIDDEKRMRKNRTGEERSARETRRKGGARHDM